MTDQQKHRCARATAIAVLGAAMWLSAACSTLQRLGTPTGSSAALRAGAVAPASDPSRDKVHQLLEARAPNIEGADRQRVVEALLSAQQQHGFEPSLLLAVMQVESGFNPAARSSQGALGLMQVLPFSGQLMARELGIQWRGASTLLDPEQNVRIGAAYLARMNETFRDIDLSLAAYNVGPGRLQNILDAGRRPAGVYARKVQSCRAEIASASGLRP